jgi:hypothetical protein
MNDTLIFLALAGLALIFKWLTSHGSGDSAKPEPPLPNEQAPPPRQPPQSEEERIRRFLEALGAPPGTRPPPPIRPRRVVTPAAAPAQRPKAKRSWVQPLPPLVTTPKDFGPPPPTTTPFEPVVAEVTTPIAVAPPPPIISPSAPVPMPRTTATSREMLRQSLGTLLRQRGSVRQAIILREVLGPPRGLQALDDLRSF